MLTTLSSRPAWRQLLTMAIALPALVGLAVLVFAWPAARTEPRQLPIGMIGASGATEHAVSTIEANEPGAFDLRIYGTTSSAREAIEDREVYGAIDISGPQVTVYTASAASPSVSSLLASLGDELQSHLAQASGQSTSAAASPATAQTVDVVATDGSDPRGSVLTSALLPLTICSVIIAAAIALALEFGPAWRMIGAVTTVAAVAGLAAYLVAQTWLGALPGNGLETWASLSLLILAMSATTAGLIALIGSPGLGLGALVMVFIGNPFAGATSAPELLPDFADRVGQWLPPGAGANLIRSATYFDGHDAQAHVAILLAWTLFGCLAIVSGHHTFIGFAAKRRTARHAAEEQADSYQPSQPSASQLAAAL
ncbi:MULTISPECIES: ABC transporter permease [unclassified Nocardioides]|uniref:ABC transporter permease n=1 Tax=unclassified Nocardioides TaxID=2615069 RepID=UPI0009F11DDB|nr:MULTISPECIES: ABC transporter permease [unclassified Nocardioides]GAW47994.1 uncharacterized protein PD653B2_0305 [Nocardioides sp. PD653-B2]GAW53703.1 uncharacterized protein PD653_1106 [Nocardioides sp. PD653]